MKQGSPLLRRLLRGALTGLLAAALMCAFFLAVIMGQPQSEGDEGRQALPAPLDAALLITEKADFGALLDAFPAPVMAAMNAASLTFQQGDCRDVPFEDGVARVATVTYLTADGSLVTVQSIYPARALAVLGKGEYVISGTAGQPLAGLRSIRMDSATHVRMHAEGEEALYAVTMPLAPSATLRQLTSMMQLYRGN